MRPQILLVLCALVTIPGIAHAQRSLPPLNGVSQRQENPVWVGDHRFGSASYTYFVDVYRIDSLHYTKSINSGPHGWDVIVESGQVIVNHEPQTRNGNGSFQPAPTLPALPPISHGTRPLPNLAPLPATSGTLPHLPALTPLRP